MKLDDLLRYKDENMNINNNGCLSIKGPSFPIINLQLQFPSSPELVVPQISPRDREPFPFVTKEMPRPTQGLEAYGSIARKAYVVIQIH